MTTFMIVTRLDYITNNTHIDTLRHERADLLNKMKLSLDVPETHKRMEGKMSEIMGEMVNQVKRFDEIAKQANGLDEIAELMKILVEISEKVKRFEDITGRIDQIHEVGAKILEHARKRTAEIEERVEKQLKRKVSDDYTKNQNKHDAH